MLVRDPQTAQIQLILATDDLSQVQDLRRDLSASNYVYSFLHLSNRSDVLPIVRQQVVGHGRNARVVLVIHYMFVEQDCEALLKLARDAAPGVAIECIVTGAPADQRTRGDLLRLGAHVFDDEMTDSVPQATLH